MKPRRPAGDFSKQNWGDHTAIDTSSNGVNEMPTRILVALVEQLRLWQWEKILTAALSASKQAHKPSNQPTTSSNIPKSEKPKPVLRDDDSDLK